MCPSFLDAFVSLSLRMLNAALSVKKCLPSQPFQMCHTNSLLLVVGRRLGTPA